MDHLRLVAIVALTSLVSQAVYGQGRGIIFCYYDSTATLRSGDGKVYPGQLNPEYCTHMAYNSFGIHRAGALVMLLHPNNDIKNGTLEKFLALKKRNPKLKMFASIGGHGVDSRLFSDVVHNNQRREHFVTNILKFVQRHGFDGANIHWVYPGLYGGRSSDKYRLVVFLKRLREEFDKHKLLLVLTAGGSAELMTVSYDIPRISQYVHFVNIATCEYHIANDTTTGENSPLYLSEVDTDPTLSVDSTIKNWIERGAPRYKITLGVAAFGVSYTLKDKTKTNIGAPTTGPGVAGPYLNIQGRMMYIEICRRFINKPKWTIRFHDVQKNPYAFKKYQWIGYDNVRSVKIKARYAKDENLGGVSVWTLDYDDVHNYCKGGKQPLMRAVYSAMGG